MSALDHIISVSRMAAARGDTGPLSTGESLAAALVLNRADWLADMGYTMVRALERIGDEWVSQLGAASRVLAEDAQVVRVVAEGIEHAKKRPAPAQTAEGPTTLDYAATLVTYGGAPGYRRPSLTLDLRELDGTTDGHRLRATLFFDAEGSADIAQHLIREHASAWKTERGPIDKAEGEQRPRWLGNQ